MNKRYFSIFCYIDLLLIKHIQFEHIKFLLTFILLFNTNNLLCYINILLILLINYDISEFIFIY